MDSKTEALSTMLCYLSLDICAHEKWNASAKRGIKK